MKRYHWIKQKCGSWHPESYPEARREGRVTCEAMLVDAIAEAWTHCLKPPYGSGRFTPEDGQTDCNGFVAMVAHRMGFDGFKPEGARWPMRANEMVDLMRSSELWKKIEGASAQFYANHGYFVVAGWQNPDKEKSGHVAVVRPGMLGTSGKWKILTPGVPKVANVGGAAECRMDRGANWAFGPMPDYYVFIGDKNGKFDDE